MTTDIHSELQKELRRGERLLWAGQPGKGIRLQSSDAFQIPFAVLWCGFVATWEFGVIQSDNWFMILWGVPFVAIGIWMLVGRLFYDAWRRSRTIYGVTSDRVLLITNTVQRSVKTVPLDGMPEISLRERRDGRGTIVLGGDRGGSTWFAGNLNGGGPYGAPPTLEWIEGARAVQEILLDARHALRVSVSVH
jgi:hypothetical protein